MITGREANILARLDPQEQAKILAAERRAIARVEKEEQKLFSSWLNLQKGAGKLTFINPFSHKPSTIQPGWPDYTILLKPGRVLLIEMKVEGGKLSKEQQTEILCLETLDHPVHVCWNHVQAINVVQLYLSVTDRKIHDHNHTSIPRTECPGPATAIGQTRT